MIRAHVPAVSTNVAYRTRSPSALVKTLFSAVAILAASLVQAAPADVTVSASHAGGSVHMLTGQGGNIAVSVGPDGTLMVDDQFAPLAAKIMAAIEGLGGSHPRILINTHYHGDHTGGNADFGEQSVIVAHDRVRVRLLDEDLPRSALPLLTFDDKIRIHFNDDQIDVIHLPHGHTDGDAIVWFKTSNVVHMGDQFFAGAFPYVDVEAGGSVDGLVRNIERIIDRVPTDVRIIPGHGPMSTVLGLSDAVETIKSTRDIVRNAVAAGTVDELKKTGFGPQYDSWSKGFISASAWIDIVQASDAAPERGKRSRRRAE